jgi:DNA-binding IclR family transcriptional regulator
VVRGRPRETSGLVEIARELERGVSQAEVARTLDMATSTVQRRVATMRALMAEETGDTAYLRDKTTVEVARDFLRHVEAEEA